MKAFLDGVFGQIRLLLTSRLGLCLLGLLVAMSVVTGAVYERLVLRDVPVAVVDLDGTHLTRVLTTSLDATPELAVQWVPGGSLETARAQLESGEVSAYVLIPTGFTARIKQGQKGQLVVASDMSNVLLSKTVRSACSRVVATLNVGVEIGVLRKLGSSRPVALAEAYPVVVEDNQLFNPATNYAEYLVPVVVFFLLHIYATVLFAGSFLDGWGPHKTGRRLGQMLVTWVFCSALAVVTWRALPWSQVSVASPWWLGALVFVAYAASQAAFVVAISMIVPNTKVAFQVILFLSMLALMLSGVTWPTYEFPPVLARLSELLPFTHLARLLRMTIHFEASFSDVTPSLVALAELTLGGGVLAIAFGLLRARIRAFGQ